MAKTLLFAGFRSRHDLRFFEKRVNTSIFLRSSRQKIGSKREENAVIYRGLAPSRAKNCVNTSVSASKSGQNTAIYSVSCLPRFLEIAKTLCKYQHFLRSTRQKCCNLQFFFCLAFKNTGICGVLCISGPKSIGIYSIFCFFCMAPAKDVKTQKCCNL